MALNEAINRLIETALSEAGYLEKATNSQLDSATANAGRGNYTKYARDLDAISGFYNGPKNGFAWCDVFVDWCFVQTFGVALAKKMLCQPDKSLGAGCKYSLGYYKAKGRFHTTPEPGDQIFFGSASSVTHTGIVLDVSDGRVRTIEGNTSTASGVVANGGAVCSKSYPLGSKSIVGYGRPDYSLAPIENDERDNTPDEYAKSAIEKAVARGILRGNSKGDLMLHSPLSRQDFFVLIDRLGLMD